MAWGMEGPEGTKKAGSSLGTFHPLVLLRGHRSTCDARIAQRRKMTSSASLVWHRSLTGSC